MRTFLKRVLGVLVVAGIAAAVVHFTGVDFAGKQAAGKRGGKGGFGDVVPVAAALAATKDVDVYLEGVGSARARNSVTVKPQVDGKIIAVNFREGQDVKKGDVLAKIDPTTYKAQLDQAVAKKSLDEVQLANAKLDYERYVKVGPNVVTQKQIDTQRATVAQFTAQVQADEAAIANARAILAYTDVVAPIDGRTGLRLVDEGNLVRSGDAGIVTITQVKPISVLFTLPQQELPRITAAMDAGTLAAVALDATGKKPIDHGKLEVVDNQVDQATGTIRLKAEFPNDKLQLWPGQFTNVRLRVETLKQVVVVPTPAIQRGPTGPFVYVVADGTVSLRNVKIPHQTDTEAVISEGVATGAQVVTAGFARLRDGAKVSLSPEDTGAPGAKADPADKAPSQGGGKPATVSDAQPAAAADTPEAGGARAAEFRTAPANDDAPAARTGEHKRGDGKRRRREAASEAQ